MLALDSKMEARDPEDGRTVEEVVLDAGGILANAVAEAEVIDDECGD